MYRIQTINITKVVIVMLMGILFFSSIISAEDKIMIEDYQGVTITLKAPVNTIICLHTSAAQIIMALDCYDRVIGLDKNSKDDLFPRPEREVKTVGQNPYTPQIEAIVELEPDLVIADTQLHDDQKKMIESFGIPVMIERTSDDERVLTTIRNIAKIVEKEEKGEKLISFITYYRELIKARVAELSEDEKKRVYWEWYKPFKTGSRGSTVHSKIVQSGGINICADAEGNYPTVSSEYVWESNPDVIIKQESRGASLVEMKEAYNKLISRTSLKATNADQKNKVYVITWDIFSGLPSIIGDLYFAKWIQPELFKDINPEQVYARLLKEFFAVEEFTTRVYP